MTPEGAKLIPDGTKLWMTSKTVMDDKDYDPAPDRCHIYSEKTPGISPAPEGMAHINAGGWCLTWPVSRLHVRYRDAVKDVRAMLREHRAKVDDAISQTQYLLNAGEPAEDDE